MSGPSSDVGRVGRLASQVEYDAMPDACGRPPPGIENDPNWTTEIGESSSSFQHKGGESVFRGTGQVYETSEGSSGGSEQIPSGRRQNYSQVSPTAISQFSDSVFDKFTENYSFQHRYSRSELPEFHRRLQVIRKHFERLPDELKTAYYDVMVLYSEDDRPDAESFCQSLNDLSLENGKRVKAVLYDVMDFANVKRRMFGSLEIAFEHCTFAFVYLTKQFCKCEWSQIASEECLMEAIYNKDKRWCVVPVYTVQRTKADFRIPMGLNSLKGINFYNNDDFYRRGLRSLIGGKIYKREDNEEKLFIQQYREALELDKKMQMEAKARQQKLEEAEHVKNYPHVSSNEKNIKHACKTSPEPNSSKSLEDFEESMPSNISSGGFTIEQFPSKTDSNRSNFHLKNSVSGYTSGESLRSRGPQGDQSDSLMSYSLDGPRSMTTCPSHQGKESSLQEDRVPVGQGKEALGKRFLSEGDTFGEATGGKSELDKDGKVVVHHIHTHTHIYEGKEPEKANKSVVHIYAAENVVIGDHATFVENTTQPNPSDDDPDIPANSRKKPHSTRDESPTSPKSMEGPNRQSKQGHSQQSIEGPSRPSMRGQRQQSMEGHSRQSIEGPSRQSIDGHPSSLSPEIHDTTTKKFPAVTNDECNMEENFMEIREKISVTPNRQASAEASKTYCNMETTASGPASFPLTKSAASVPSTFIASTVQSKEVAPNIPPVNNVTANNPSANVTANTPSANVTANIPSANVTANIPSTNVTANIPSANVTASRNVPNIENVSNKTLATTNCDSAGSSSNVNSEQTQPGPNVSGGTSDKISVSDGKVSSPKQKRGNAGINLPKRPITFTNTRPKPQAMAKVMPLQTQKTTVSSENEFRNDFGHASLVTSEFGQTSQTKEKELYQDHNTQVKTPVSGESEDEDETVVKQVASVSPINRTDLEPDCQNETETSLKSYSRAGLTDLDQDDQAVTKVLEMGFPEADIKAALVSLQSRAPGRRHFSVPNLLDEMEKLQQEPDTQDRHRLSSDVETDGLPDSGFVLLTGESSRQNNLATNRGNSDPQDSPSSNVSSPNSGFKDKEKCTIS